MRRLAFGYAGVLLFLCVAAGVAHAQVRSLTILHTNDLHAHLLPDAKGNGGFARVAAVLRRETQGCHSCLVLNGGDLVQGTPVSTIFKGLPIYQIANLFHFDASVLGNHEFDYGWQRVQQFIRTAQFPVIAANVEDRDGKLFTKPYVILPVNGIRVAIVGEVTAELRSLVGQHLLGPWRARPVVESARHYAEQLRSQSDLIVVLGHLTENEEDALLKQVPEVSVIVSGHPHGGLDHVKNADGRVAVRAKAYGEEVGRLDLQVDLEKKAVVHSDWKIIPVSKEVVPAEDVARLVSEWESKVSQIVDVPIGVAAHSFSEQDLKPVLERAMRDEAHTDCAFVNLGGIRDGLPKGKILARSIWNIMPFDDTVVYGTFKGSELPPSITASCPVQPDRQYTVATLDFVAGAEQSELGATGLQFPQHAPGVFRDLLIDWVKKQKVIQ